MIRAVIFDCFGVLTTDTWKAFLDSLAPDINKDILRELNRQLDAGLLDLSEFTSEVFDITGTSPVMVEGLINNEATKNDVLLDYIKKLKTKNIKIGMISNVSSNWVRESFLTEDEQRLFDDMVFSFELKTTKPDPRIFEIACERLDIPPLETVMVDDIENNCRGAKAVGMQAIQYTDFSAFKIKLEELTT